jgi:antitoxin component YwqK of YwqJK toxin-antitoxin module
MEREQTFSSGQALSSQRGNILTYYFKTGIVKATGPVVGDQQMDGKWVFYKENGMISEIGHFKAGEKHGLWQRYDKLGQLEYEAEFASGKEVSNQLYR